MRQRVEMPCGWGCGAAFGAREMRKHFGECPRRPGVSAEVAEMEERAKVRELVKVEAPTPIEVPKVKRKTLAEEIRERFPAVRPASELKAPEKAEGDWRDLVSFGRDEPAGEVKKPDNTLFRKA